MLRGQFQNNLPAFRKYLDLEFQNKGYVTVIEIANFLKIDADNSNKNSIINWMNKFCPDWVYKKITTQIYGFIHNPSIEEISKTKIDIQPLNKNLASKVTQAVGNFLLNGGSFCFSIATFCGHESDDVLIWFSDLFDISCDSKTIDWFFSGQKKNVKKSMRQVINHRMVERTAKLLLALQSSFE